MAPHQVIRVDKEPLNPLVEVHSAGSVSLTLKHYIIQLHNDLENFLFKRNRLLEYEI